MLHTRCSICGKPLEIRYEYLGKQFFCPGCGNAPLLFSEAGLDGSAIQEVTAEPTPKPTPPAAPTSRRRAFLILLVVFALGVGAVVFAWTDPLGLFVEP